MKVNGSSITVSFDSAKGLKTKDGKAPTQFWLAGQNKEWHRAKAKIEGETVVLSADAVAKPVAVRYAFAAHPQPRLVNGAGLPAYPFRTDNWKR